MSDKPKIRGYNPVIITAHVYVDNPTDAPTWAVVENVELTMRKACEEVAEEFNASGVGVEVRIK